MLNDFVTRDDGVRVYGGTRGMFDRKSDEWKECCEEFKRDLKLYWKLKREWVVG